MMQTTPPRFHRTAHLFSLVAAAALAAACQSPSSSGGNGGTGGTGGAGQGGSGAGTTETGTGGSGTGTGGSDTGTGGAGTGGTGTGTGGSGAGSGSGGTGPVYTTCEALEPAFAAETQKIRGCTKNEECGQVLIGTSCGCTRNWVARLDADTTHFYELIEQGNALECDLPLASTCDCPGTDGFECTAGGICQWNYL